MILIATHPDSVRLPRDANGDYFTEGVEDLVSQLQQQFLTTFRIHAEPFVMDARAPGASVMRCLRQQLAEMKQNVIHVSSFLFSRLERLPMGLFKLIYSSCIQNFFLSIGMSGWCMHPKSTVFPCLKNT